MSSPTKNTNCGQPLACVSAYITTQRIHMSLRRQEVSRGKPLAQSSGAQGSCSAAANPDTVEIDGVGILTNPVVEEVFKEEAEKP